MPSTTSNHSSAAATQAVGAKRTVHFRIRRCEGPGKPSRWENFSVPVTKGEGANVQACLERIASNPVTTEGKDTTPVVWDAGCLEEVCGACTMVINGRVRQACTCLIDSYAPNDGDKITLEPMSKFPVVRDLWVDRSRMFETLKRFKPWSPIDGLYALGPGPQETPATQQTRYVFSTCMTCGCCLEACPQFGMEADEGKWKTSFVGANAIGQVRMFNMHTTAKEFAGDRLDEMSAPGGIANCGNAQNCVQVCPKEIPLTEAIAAVGRAVTIHGVKKFFSGK